MKRSLLRKLAQGAIGVLLFAQLAVAAYACPTLTSASATQVPAGTAHGPDCADPSGTLDPAATNLCAEHCKSDQQSNATATVNVPLVLLSVLYAMPQAAAATVPPRATAASLSALVAGRPPHAILHCVLRT